MKKSGKITFGIVGGVVGALVVIALGVYCSYFCFPVDKSSQGKINVACVGDSITYGDGVYLTRAKDSYPAILQKMMGEKYNFMNFGYCGATMQDKADVPYRNLRYYKGALDSKADVYVLMLGTNDAKPRNWNADRYEEDLRDCVNVLLKNEGCSKVILMKCPAVFEVNGKTIDTINDELVRTGVNPIVEKVGKETGVTVIDLYALTENRPDLFADGVHPNREGNQKIADLIARAL